LEVAIDIGFPTGSAIAQVA
jgi:hypothetical protein